VFFPSAERPCKCVTNRFCDNAVEACRRSQFHAMLSCKKISSAVLSHATRSAPSRKGAIAGRRHSGFHARIHALYVPPAEPVTAHCFAVGSRSPAPRFTCVFSRLTSVVFVFSGGLCGPRRQVRDCVQAHWWRPRRRECAHAQR